MTPRDLYLGLLQLVYPNTCGACHVLLPADHAPFCDPCRGMLLADAGPACPRCAVTIGPFAHVEGGCSQCRTTGLAFDRALRLGIYDGLLREVVLRLKHRAGEGLAELLTELWANHADKGLRDLKADAVVPVPLHWWRRWRRGYNQSGVLSEGLARHLGLPHRPRWLRRIRNTPRQTLQPASGRKDNVRGAFRATPHPEMKGKTILLVDDVMTTGNTCNEAARALRQAGAARVVVAVLARAQM